MIRHLVVMKFTDPADAAEGKKRLEALAGEVAEIASLRVDLDSGDSPTGHQLALLTTHRDSQALAGYQHHPAHIEVAAWLRERLVDRAVVDSEGG